MGWGNCGTDSDGRPIGYVFPATCDHPGCEAEIDRGLSYVCGDMHGASECSCEGYFCHEHQTGCVEVGGHIQTVCAECHQNLIDDPDWIEGDDGVFRDVIDLQNRNQTGTAGQGDTAEQCGAQGNQ